jgi:hypothetical protein
MGSSVPTFADVIKLPKESVIIIVRVVGSEVEKEKTGGRDNIKLPHIMREG